MSQPVKSGEQLQVEVKDGVLKVTNDPGFSSESGDAPYRAVWLRRSDGSTVFGRELGKSTPFEMVYEGFFGSRDKLAAWSRPVSPYTYTLRVYGGTHSKQETGDTYDKIEWGYQGPKGEPNEVEFVVPTNTPSPPSPASSQFDVHRLEEIRTNTLAEEKLAKASFADWRKANPGEYDDVIGYLSAVANGWSLTPPSLKTHRGRAVVGLLQAAAEVLGRLP